MSESKPECLVPEYWISLAPRASSYTLVVDEFAVKVSTLEGARIAVVHPHDNREYMRQVTLNEALAHIGVAPAPDWEALYKAAWAECEANRRENTMSPQHIVDAENAHDAARKAAGLEPQ